MVIIRDIRSASFTSVDGISLIDRLMEVNTHYAQLCVSFSLYTAVSCSIYPYSKPLVIQHPLNLSLSLLLLLSIALNAMYRLNVIYSRFMVEGNEGAYGRTQLRNQSCDPYRISWYEPVHIQLREYVRIVAGG